MKFHAVMLSQKLRKETDVLNTLHGEVGAQSYQGI